MDTTQNLSDKIDSVLIDSVEQKDVVIQNGSFGLSPEAFELSKETVLRSHAAMQSFVDNAMSPGAVSIHDSLNFQLNDAVTQAHTKIAEEALQATLKGEFLGVEFGSITSAMLEQKIRELGISPEVLYSDIPAYSAVALSGRGTFGNVMQSVDELGYRTIKDFEMLGVSIVSPDSVVDEQCRILDIPHFPVKHVPKIFDYELIGGV